MYLMDCYTNIPQNYIVIFLKTVYDYLISVLEIKNALLFAANVNNFSHNLCNRKPDPAKVLILNCFPQTP
jgi:hypothetical protein